MARRLIDSDRQRDRNTQQRLQGQIERRYMSELAKELRNAMNGAVEHFERSGNVRVDDQHARRVYRMLRGEWESSIEVFGDRILEAIKSTHGPRVVKADRDSLLERIVQQWLLTRGGERIADDIAETTKRQIAQQVAMGRREGLGTSAIARQVRDRIGGLSLVRAAVIARTETHNAANFGQIEAIKDTGLKARKEWISAADDRTRDEEFNHVAADGQTVELDASFSISGESLAYPGDPGGSAGNVINCRCATGFVTHD